jgi:PAS domain S-box-containing protein
MLILDEPDHSLWERFERGTLRNRDLDIHPIVRRWIRASLARRSGPQPSAVVSDAEMLRELTSRATLLNARVAELFESASADLQRSGFATIIADRDGVILASRGVELVSDLESRATLANGMSLSEAERGTNAIGTALAEGTAVAVIGGAHSEPDARQLCCYAAPIRDARNEIVAVLDITGPREAANALLGVTVESIAAALETALRLRQLGRDVGTELVVAEEYVTKSRSEPGPASTLHGHDVDSSVRDSSAQDWRTSQNMDLKLSAVLETLPVAAWVADADGTIVLSNRAARDLWGGEIRPLRKDYDLFKAWWPDGRRVGAQDWGLPRALSTGNVIIDEEIKIETFDGQHKIIRNSAAPIFDHAGRIVGGVAVNEDITFLKRAEATRDLFAGILGHDLRSPLNAITMATALLLRKGDLNSDQLRSVLRIQSSGLRIQQLVDDLLDFTRARFGMKFPLNPVQTDMGDIAGSVVEEIRAAHPDRVVRLERRGDLLGNWDPARVTQVVANLINNAVQHGKDPIVVDVADQGDAVTLAVSNAGAPIPEGKRAGLFEPFRKGSDSKGFGLGLFIAHEVVRSHAGTIEVTSNDERTMFTTRWPRVSERSP